MRTVLLLLTSLICTTSFGQFSGLKGTWISSSNDVMFIDDETNKADNSNMLCTSKEEEGMALYLLGDTLSFQKRYYSSATNFKKLYINRYDLIIVKRTQSKLIVKPCSKLSKKFFENRKIINFIKQEYNQDKSIIFEKIIYHTTSCFGSCPTIDLEIDKTKSVYLDGQFFKEYPDYEIDSIKSGQFKGKLTDSLFKELILILQTSNLKTLKFPKIFGNDAPVTTLIIYYNGQRKYLKSMFPPTIANKLIEFLYLINQNTILTRTDKKKTLEK